MLEAVATKIGGFFFNQAVTPIIEVLDAGQSPFMVATLIEELSDKQQADIKRAIDHYLNVEHREHEGLARLQEILEY